MIEDRFNENAVNLYIICDIFSDRSFSLITRNKALLIHINLFLFIYLIYLYKPAYISFFLLY